MSKSHIENSLDGVQKAIREARNSCIRQMLESDYPFNNNMIVPKEVFNPYNYKIIRSRLMKRDKLSWKFVDSNFERKMWRAYSNGTLKFRAVIDKENQIDNEDSEITTNESDFNSQIISTCQKY